MADTETAMPQEVKPTASLADRVADLLAEEGYRPHVEEPDGPFRCVDFKVEGARHRVRLCEDDPDFVMICVGYLFDEPIPDANAALRAGHDAQAEAKVAKFFLDPDGRYYEIQAELFLGGQALNAKHLERCVHALKQAVDNFYQRIRAEAPRAQA